MLSRTFFIYSPLWRENAAGIKVLYLLCHYLNSLGADAYIVPIGFGRRNHPSDLKVKYISESWKKRKKLKKKNPIVIYSETIRGNPLSSNQVIRYFLNYPGLLNSNVSDFFNEYALPYTHNISESLTKLKLPNISKPLFISSINISEIHNVSEKQNYVALYASKYRRYVGKPNVDFVDAKVVEIFGRGRRAQNRVDTLNIIANAKSLICFENSAIVTEAILSRTPVFLDENILTKNPIASKELGEDGVYKLAQFRDLKIDQCVFSIAREKFLIAQSNIENEISDFLYLVDNDQFFDVKQACIRVKGRINRTVNHKIIFAPVLFSNLLKKYERIVRMLCSI